MEEIYTGNIVGIFLSYSSLRPRTEMNLNVQEQIKKKLGSYCARTHLHFVSPSPFF